MNEKLTQEQMDVLVVAPQHTGALTEHDRDVIQRINRRLSNWGERGNFVTYKESRVLARIEIKLQTFMDRYRAKRQLPANKEFTQRCCEKLRQKFGFESSLERQAS